MRHDLEGFILAYIESAGIADCGKDTPLFRAGINGMGKRLTGNWLASKRICELVKRRLKDAGLPSRLSPHSLRVTAITDLLTQGIPLGRAIPGRARGAANDRALRPAAEKGDAEYRRADLELVAEWDRSLIRQRFQSFGGQRSGFLLPARR